MESKLTDRSKMVLQLAKQEAQRPGCSLPDVLRREDVNDEQIETLRKGNAVATAVWKWLQQKRRLTFVPWVLDPKSDKYDPFKAAQQSERDQLLAELESVIRNASEENEAVGIKMIPTVDG